LRRDLVARAKRGPAHSHTSREMGGVGLNHVEKAIVFEETGYSWLGPTAMNIHAPHEGNIHLMDGVATLAQKYRWLRPQVAGETRSCFAMTEPDGADPGVLATTATKEGDDFLVSGREWFIIGAKGASYVIIMARMQMPQCVKPSGRSATGAYPAARSHDATTQGSSSSMPLIGCY
jgi:acyl-CoA dehydrogenase